MPEFVKRRVGSLPGTGGLEATIVCPLPSKYFRNSVRISLLRMAMRGNARRSAPRYGKEKHFSLCGPHKREEIGERRKGSRLAYSFISLLSPLSSRLSAAGQSSFTPAART